MSAPPKRQTFTLEQGNGEDSSEQESENEEDMDYNEKENIQVDFEGRAPADMDFHGINQLLKQLFLKAHIDLGKLTDLIISQNFIGSVVKQSGVDELNPNDEDDEEDEDDDHLKVFAVSTVINLSSTKNEEVLAQLRSLLLELSAKHGTQQCSTTVKTLLEDKSKSLGLIIHERYLNIPAELAIPVFTSLSKEIKKGREKEDPFFNFSHYVFICKLHKTTDVGKKKKGKINKQEIIWSNPEEEIIDELADYWFEFCVKDESDTGLSGNWDEDDVILIPYRRIMFLKEHKLDLLIDKINEALKSNS